MTTVESSKTEKESGVKSGGKERMGGGTDGGERHTLNHIPSMSDRYYSDRELLFKMLFFPDVTEIFHKEMSPLINRKRKNEAHPRKRFFSNHLIKVEIRFFFFLLKGGLV